MSLAESDGMSDPHLRRRFLEGMSRAANTVSVVTSDGPAGRADTRADCVNIV